MTAFFILSNGMLISVTGGRFPRAVREPPHRKLLRGLTWTRFPRWSRRLSLQPTIKVTMCNADNYYYLECSNGGVG